MNFIYVLSCILIVLSAAECTSKIRDKSIDIESEPKAETTTIAMSIEERGGSEDFNLIEVMVECNDSFRIESSYLENFNRSGSFPDETDKTPKCYMRCVLEKSGVASPTSQFDVKRTAEIFPLIRDVPEEDIVQFATDCTDRPETCKCERSYRYLKCLMETVINKYDMET